LRTGFGVSFSVRETSLSQKKEGGDRARAKRRERTLANDTRDRMKKKPFPGGWLVNESGNKGPSLQVRKGGGLVPAAWR